jgi:cyclopropane fatty-acyl-phospholipid synthase-like methyltransferase
MLALPLPVSRSDPMKSMKLYSDVHRIYNSLAAIGIAPDDSLSVAQLTPFDQYHYDGTTAVDIALERLELKAGAQLLDIGSGIGGPARYIADKTGVHVTALELQADLDAVARDLTARCGLAGQVTHLCGNILDGSPRGPFDGIISMLCMLHIPDKARLFAACRAALKPGCAMYVEDFARARTLTVTETDCLAVKVQSVGLPSPAEYHTHLQAAGFSEIIFTDVTGDWQRVSAGRVQAAREGRAANVAVHGETIMAGLEDFYSSVDDLWQGGALTGLRILAR